MSNRERLDTDADVVVVGAGMSGLYALKVLRERGFRVVVLEKAPAVGGTWFWNRYPGARCDVPSVEYSFGFDPELEQEWEWTEHFASQPEIESYLNHVADRYDLRRDIRLGCGVTAQTWDDTTDTWVFETETGERVRSRFAIMATGGLSAPHRPDWPGMDTFEGVIAQTSLWPEEGVELAAKRAGLVGTGSSGVQAAPEIAKVAEHLTVFQRTAAFTWPSHNKPLTAVEQSEVKARYRELRREQYASAGGTAGTSGAVSFTRPIEGRMIKDSTPEEREAALEEHGFSACRIWSDIATDLDANEMAVELFREQIRRTIKDPELADSLTPKGYPLGCKRPVLDAGYFETFNRDNVSLVDLRKDPIVEVRPNGIRTEHGFVELDVLVLATGFDAMTGALTRIDVRGAGGRLLNDHWRDGPRTYLGLSVAGFPNMFMCVGPSSPAVLANYPPQIELQVGWIAELLEYITTHVFTRAEAQIDAEDTWSELVAETAQGTMLTAETCNSWYLGANIEGKPRVFLAFAGGLAQYVAHCDAVAADGYPGFVFTVADHNTTPLGSLSSVRAAHDHRATTSTS